MSNPHSAEVKEDNVPTCPFCEKKHGMDVECKVSDLKKSMTSLLAKYLKTAGLDSEKKRLQTLLDEAVKVIEKQCEEMQVFLNVSLKCHFPDARAVQDEAREFLDMVNLNKAVNEKLSGDILSTISRLEYLRLDVEALNVAPREVLMSCIAHWAEKAMGKRLNMIGGE